MKHQSLWFDTDEPPARYPALEGERRVDVAVVGAGITGMTAALLLARAGRSVAVLDQHAVAGGTTGHSTAKITSQHGLIYASLRLTHGRGTARAYAAAMESAKERIAELAGEGIECGFRRRAAYVYGSEESHRRRLEREAGAASQAGLPATFIETAPLPFDTHGAVRFDDQAEFDPRAYVAGLARLLVDAGGEVFERTRAHQVHEGAPCRVETERGTLLADDVVVATLMPFLDRGGFFARAHARRSYIVTARIAEAPPDGMFINAGAPTRSLRAHPFGGSELLLVGGEGHHVGSTAAQPERYEQLIEFARRHWDVRSIEHAFSSQDFSPDDHVPYAGRLHLRSKHVYVATGLNKWGITAGTAAAGVIADAVLGVRTSGPACSPPRASARSKRRRASCSRTRVSASASSPSASSSAGRARSPTWRPARARSSPPRARRSPASATPTGGSTPCRAAAPTSDARWSGMPPRGPGTARATRHASTSTDPCSTGRR